MPNDVLKLAEGESLVLASASPRRRFLLENAGIKVICKPSNADESGVGGMPSEMVMELARMKALDVCAELSAGSLVLGADTVVVLGEKVFGKPLDMEDACRMLLNFSGKTHQVMTGVYIARTGEDRKPLAYKSFVAITDVQFRKLSEDDVRKYHGFVNPLDKAGAYGIQEHGDMIVERIDGSLSNVIGLPVEEVLAVIGK